MAHELAVVPVRYSPASLGGKATKLSLTVDYEIAL